MITDMIDEMVGILAVAKEDADKFEEKGNASAGRRVRVAMQGLKKKAQDVRIAITTSKKD
jgi:hypothetical protein